MRQKTYLVIWTIRQASSGYLWRFGSDQRQTWNSAMKSCLATVQAQFKERGTPFTESHKKFEKADGPHTHGIWGWTNAYDIRLDFEIKLILNPDTVE